jgi:hypothetical protein
LKIHGSLLVINFFFVLLPGLLRQTLVSVESFGVAIETKAQRYQEVIFLIIREGKTFCKLGEEEDEDGDFRGRTVQQKGRPMAAPPIIENLWS